MKLQKALGIPEQEIDGIWGPKTEEYIKEHLKEKQEATTSTTTTTNDGGSIQET